MLISGSIADLSLKVLATAAVEDEIKALPAVLATISFQQLQTRVLQNVYGTNISAVVQRIRFINDDDQPMIFVVCALSPAVSTSDVS